MPLPEEISKALILFSDESVNVIIDQTFGDARLLTYEIVATCELFTWQVSEVAGPQSHTYGVLCLRPGVVCLQS